MIPFRAKYPEGAPWDGSEYYEWNGGVYTGGYGCVAFAFMLGDAAFGELPARVVVQDGITYLGSRTFANHSALTEVILPDSVTEIDQEAFLSCTALPPSSFPQSW